MIVRARTTAAAGGAFAILIGMPGCAEDVPMAPRSLPKNVPAAVSQPEEEPAVTMDGSSTRRTIGPRPAAYYTTSPAQGRPPDGELPPGTAVNLAENAGSYARVTWNGQSVWVATEALEEPPAEPRPMHKIPTH
jgi:hypothetical protein